MMTMIPDQADYTAIHADIVALLDNALRVDARNINAIMTATYWEIGRRITEFEQGGQERPAYGEEMIKRLGSDLSRQFGRASAGAIWLRCASFTSPGL